MIHAFFRGWLAAMAALLIEVFITTFLSSPSDILFSLLPNNAEHDRTLLIISACVEEITLFASLARISFPIGLFRRALLLGMSAGIGFAVFEAAVKILFLGGDETTLLFSGILSGSFLHLATGALIGTTMFFWRQEKRMLSLCFFFGAILAHLLYNFSIASLSAGA